VTARSLFFIISYLRHYAKGRAGLILFENSREPI